MGGVFELKQASNGQFMFNLRAGNGEIILTSPIYKTRIHAEEAIGSVRVSAPLDARYERRIANPGEHYFVLKNAAGEVLARSELYRSEQALENGIAAAQRNAPDARFRDLSAGLAGAH